MLHQQPTPFPPVENLLTIILCLSWQDGVMQKYSTPKALVDITTAHNILFDCVWGRYLGVEYLQSHHSCHTV